MDLHGADVTEVLEWIRWRDNARNDRGRRNPWDRCWGISSDALASYALGERAAPRTPGHPIKPFAASWKGDQCGSDEPYDCGDLAACERTYAKAPSELRAVMLPVLDQFRWWVLCGINRHGELLNNNRPTGNENWPEDLAELWRPYLEWANV